MTLKLPFLTACALLAILPDAAFAASFLQFTDRTAFSDTAGPTRTETFNDVTADTNLTTAYEAGGFTMRANRLSGTSSSSSMIDAAPFALLGGIDGSTYVSAAVSDTVETFLFTFNEGITAFGANFLSGASGQVELLIDGELVKGVIPQRGFLGYVSDTAFTRVELRARTGSAYRYDFDNLTFSGAIPEPASWAMMIGGLALTGGVMRRRARPLAFVRA